MAYEFKYQKMVEFAETDMAGILHFSNYFRYMEMAEHAFYRSLGFSVHTEFDGMLLGWPRIDVQCEYKAPLRFEDIAEVTLKVAKRSTRSLTLHFTIEKVSGDAPQAVARGKFTVVCVERGGDGTVMRPMRIPAEIAEKIDVHPDLQ